MLTKDDLFLLLDDIEHNGTDVKNYNYRLAVGDTIPKDILKFINDNRQFDVANFYEMLRHNYNKKKAPLYKNLVKEQFESSGDALTTLAALNLQILLYANKLADNKMFLKHSRAEEITQVLNNYFKNYDLLPCLKLLRLIKNDLKCFENL